jgi:hypothetical protein
MVQYFHVFGSVRCSMPRPSLVSHREETQAQQLGACWEGSSAAIGDKAAEERYRSSPLCHKISAAGPEIQLLCDLAAAPPSGGSLPPNKYCAGWPRGPGISQLPSAVVSTVGLPYPSGSPSCCMPLTSHPPGRWPTAHWANGLILIIIILLVPGD